MKRYLFHHRIMICAVVLACLLPVGVCSAMDLAAYTAAVNNARQLSENLPFKAQGQILDQWTEARINELIVLLQKEENHYAQLFIVGFDTCVDAAGLTVEITKRVGRSNLFMAPKAECVTPSPEGKSGRIEVWLLPVDDGA